MDNTRLYYTLMSNPQQNNMIGRQAGMNGAGGINPLDDLGNFFAKKARSAENAIGTTGASLISLGKDIGENFQTQLNQNNWKRSLDSIYNKYGFKSKQDFDDQLYAAEDAGNQAEVDRLLNLPGLNDELKAQANINAKQATDKANTYNDWRKNSYVGQKINQDRGKFAGSAMNTLSTMFDLASMAAGIPNGAAINGLQGAWEGVADYLEENGGLKSENPLDWFNPEKTDIDWAKLGMNATTGLASGMATGAFNTALDKRGIRNFLGDNRLTSGLGQNSVGRGMLGLANGAIRGGLSGAIGGATGAGVTSAINGDSIEQGLQNMGQGALRGAAGGAAIGGTMSGINMAGNATLRRYAPGFAQSLANASGANENRGIKNAWDTWKNSGDNFTDRLYSTLESGDSNVGRWLEGEPNRVLQGAGNLGNRIQDVSGANSYDDWNNAARMVANGQKSAYNNPTDNFGDYTSALRQFENIDAQLNSNASRAYGDGFEFNDVSGVAVKRLPDNRIVTVKGVPGGENGGRVAVEVTQAGRAGASPVDYKLFDNYEDAYRFANNAGGETPQRFVGVNPLGQRSEYTLDEMRNLIDEYRNYQSPRTLSGNSSSEASEVLGPAGDKLVTIYNTMHGGNTDPVYNRADGQDFLRWIDEIGGNTGEERTLGNLLKKAGKRVAEDLNNTNLGNRIKDVSDEEGAPRSRTYQEMDQEAANFARELYDWNSKYATGYGKDNFPAPAKIQTEYLLHGDRLVEPMKRVVENLTNPPENLALAKGADPKQALAEFQAILSKYGLSDAVNGGQMPNMDIQELSGVSKYSPFKEGNIGETPFRANFDRNIQSLSGVIDEPINDVTLYKPGSWDEVDAQWQNGKWLGGKTTPENEQRLKQILDYYSVDNQVKRNNVADETMAKLGANNRDSQQLQGMKWTIGEVKQTALDHIKGVLRDAGINDLDIKGIDVHGSRARGDARGDSDLDVVVEYNGNMREDDLFNLLNDVENKLALDGVDVDINPIRANETGTLPDYMQRSNAYDAEKLVGNRINTDQTFKRIKERPDSLFNSEVAKEIGAVITDNDLNMYQRALNGETLTRQEIQNSPVVKKFKEYVQNHGNDAIITKAQEKGEAIIDANTMAKLDDVANEYMRTDQSLQNAKNEGKAVIVLGMPASGKSSNAVDPYVEQGYFNLDNDNIKKLFPEYNNGLGAGNVHEASSYVSNKMVLPKITRNKTNVVIPVIGKTLTSLENYATILKNAGYNDIHLVNVDLPIEKTATRNFTRMLETSRNVDMDYVFDVVGDKPIKNYNVIKERIQNGTEPNFTSFESISTDVPFGQPARVLENSKGVQLSGEDNSGRAAIAGGNGGNLGGETPRAQSGRELGTVGADVQRLTPETEVYDALMRNEPEFDRNTYDNAVDAMAELFVNNVHDPQRWDDARIEASRALAGARTLDDLRNALVNEGLDLDEVYRVVPENNAANANSETEGYSAPTQSFAERAARLGDDMAGWDKLAQDAGFDNYGDMFQRWLSSDAGLIASAKGVEPNGIEIAKWADKLTRLINPSAEQQPRTLTDLAKKAGKRIAEDLNNTNLGLRVKDVSPEETQTYNQFKNVTEANDRRRKAYELLAQQYGTLSRRVTQATDPIETVGKMYEMGFDKPAEVEKAVNYITGANGKANILNRKVIATAGDVDTMNGVNGEPFDDFITNLVELEGIADGVHDKAVLRQINAVMKSLDSRRNGSLTGTDNAQDVFDVVQRLEDYARQDMGQSGTNYSTTTPEKRAQARVLRSVANVLLDRIYDSAADIKTVVTPEVISEMKAQFPGNERWAKWVDENIANAKSGRDLRAAQRPAVNMSKILTERSKNANTYGSNTGNLANLAKTVLTSNKLGLAMKGGELLANSDAGLRMRANRLLKKADRVANSEIPANTTETSRVEAPATAEPETVTGEVLPAYEPGRTPSAPFNAIGRYEGQQVAATPMAQQNTNTGMSFGGPSGDELQFYNLMSNIDANNNGGAQATQAATTGTTNNGLPKTGDYWTDLIGDAMMNAVNTGNVEAFGPLFEAYQGRLSKTNGSSLNNAQQTQMAKLDAADNAINELESLFEGAGGAKGPLLGWLQSVGGDWGLDSGARTYNQLSEGLVNQVAQAIGKTDSLNTEGEVKRALKLIPQLTDDAATARTKLESLRRMLATTKDSYRSAYGIKS